MPVRTIAEWGGVHEWTTDAARSLIEAGHRVTFVGAGEVFRERAMRSGAEFEVIDWDHWAQEADEFDAGAGYDMIFAHAPHARMFALRLNERLQVPAYVMLHGAFHDRMYAWHDRVDGLLAASPSLVHFAHRFGRVPPWKVSMVPNAVDEAVFDMPMPSLADRLQGGIGRVVTASRLSSDKVRQIDVTVEVAKACARILPDIQWQIDVYGDGPKKPLFESEYHSKLIDESGIAVEFHGWIAPSEVPLKMNRAVVGVVAGMTGVRTIAAGALCVGVGARDFVGVQYGQNLRAGIWSNWGDHGIFRFEPSSVSDDLEWILREGAYEDVARAGRRTLRRTNSQTVADEAMLAALQC